MAEKPENVDAAHDTGERHAAPMVEEVTDFEVLEVALRELARACHDFCVSQR